MFFVVRFLPVSARSYGGRHRGAKHSSPKRQRFMTGLALPTAAAAALMCTATGAAVVTAAKPKPKSVTVSQNVARPAPASLSLATTAVAGRLRDSRTQAIRENAQDLAREKAGARAARATHRRTLAARARQTERIAQARRWQLPIQGAERTSDFGWRWGRLHAGEDFAAPIGTNLVSMSTGTVIFAGEQSGYGTMVKISYWDGTVSFFAHMSTLAVSTGEQVIPGEVVGQSGNSGHSTGPHLHLEMHPEGGDAVDPAIWLADHKVDY